MEMERGVLHPRKKNKTNRWLWICLLLIVSSNLIVNSAGILMQEDRFSDLIRNSESRLLIISFGLIVQVFLVIMTIVLEAFFVLLALRLSKYGTAKMGVLIHIVLMGSIVTSLLSFFVTTVYLRVDPGGYNPMMISIGISMLKPFLIGFLLERELSLRRSKTVHAMVLFAGFLLLSGLLQLIPM